MAASSGRRDFVQRGTTMMRWMVAPMLVLVSACQLDNDIWAVDPVDEDDEAAGAGEARDDIDVDDMGEDDSADADPQLVAQLQAVVDQQNLSTIDPAPAVSDDLYALGQLLAFDKILSGNGDIACMTCHHPTLASGDARSLSIGAGGSGLGADRVHPTDTRIARHAPALFNLHDLDTLFWDGRVEADRRGLDTPAGGEIDAGMEDTLEYGAVAAQAMFPVTSAAEMRGDAGNELAGYADDDFTEIWAGLMTRLGDIDEYVERFEDAYPGEDFEDMTFAHAANAIGAFEVSAFESDGSPWDRFLAGDTDAMSDAQLRGASLFFGPARCVVCHSGDSLTDENFHNIGLPQIGPGIVDGEDLGREEATGAPQDRFRFRTPPLRNVALTAPYGHAGQFAELEDFIAHYDDPQQSLVTYDASQLEPVLQDQVTDNADEVLATLAPQLRGIDLRGGDVADLVAFMEALTDPAAEDMDDLIPDAVPSGLPVDD